jgi:hypothetical protein
MPTYQFYSSDPEGTPNVEFSVPAFVDQTTQQQPWAQSVTLTAYDLEGTPLPSDTGVLTGSFGPHGEPSISCNGRTIGISMGAGLAPGPFPTRGGTFPLSFGTLMYPGGDAIPLASLVITPP